MAKKTKTNENFRISKNESMFALIKDEKGKIHIVLGGYATSQKTFDTFEQAEQYIATKPYELILNMISIVIIKRKEDNENNAENPQDK